MMRLLRGFIGCLSCLESIPSSIQPLTTTDTVIWSIPEVYTYNYSHISTSTCSYPVFPCYVCVLVMYVCFLDVIVEGVCWRVCAVKPPVTYCIYTTNHSLCWSLECTLLAKLDKVNLCIGAFYRPLLKGRKENKVFLRKIFLPPVWFDRFKSGLALKERNTAWRTCFHDE